MAQEGEAGGTRGAEGERRWQRHVNVVWERRREEGNKGRQEMRERLTEVQGKDGGGSCAVSLNLAG